MTDNAQTTTAHLPPSPLPPSPPPPPPPREQEVVLECEALDDPEGFTFAYQMAGEKYELYDEQQLLYPNVPFVCWLFVCLFVCSCYLSSVLFFCCCLNLICSCLCVCIQVCLFAVCLLFLDWCQPNGQGDPAVASGEEGERTAGTRTKAFRDQGGGH